MNCNVYTIVETDKYRRDLPEMNCNVYTIVETDKVHLCSHVTHKKKRKETKQEVDGLQHSPST
jgi:hypothetical protein